VNVKKETETEEDEKAKKEKGEASYGQYSSWV